VAVLAIALALWPISCVEAVYDFGAGADGPGIGLFGAMPSSLAILQAVFIVACLFAGLAWRRVQGRGDRLGALVAGVVLCVAFVAFDCPRKLHASSWSYRCKHGEAEACSAAGTLYAFGLGVHVDQARADALYRSGCERGSYRACLDVLEQSPGDGRACSRVARQCHDPGETQWERDSACEVQAKRCATAP
jgi:hypothetical protein